jgi:stage II sporulation protein D
MNFAGSIKTADYTPAQTVSEGTGTTVIFNNDSDVLIINGKGSGHGVGMSQTGAQAMALQGYTYEDILKFYYTDIEVK